MILIKLKDLLKVIPSNHSIWVYSQDDNILFDGYKTNESALNNIRDCIVTDIQGTTFFKSKAFDENGRVDILDGTDLLLIWIQY